MCDLVFCVNLKSPTYASVCQLLSVHSVSSYRLPRPNYTIIDTHGVSNAQEAPWARQAITGHCEWILVYAVILDFQEPYECETICSFVRMCISVTNQSSCFTSSNVCRMFIAADIMHVIFNMQTF
jgi:hypothetical protein